LNSLVFQTIAKLSSYRLTEIMLLVLVVWPAPIPRGHSHGDQDLLRTDRQLVEHLEFEHGGLDNACNWPDGWHWHWSYSRLSFVGLDGEHGVADPDGVLSERPDELEPRDLACAYRTGGLDVAREAQLGKIPPHRQYSFQSVALLSSRQSLPELLGIMRL
jgi:hypothetical protein